MPLKFLKGNNVEEWPDRTLQYFYVAEVHHASRKHPRTDINIGHQYSNKNGINDYVSRITTGSKSVEPTKTSSNGSQY